MSEYRLVTSYRRPPLTTNQYRNAHYHVQHRAKKEVAEQVAWLAMQQGIGELKPSIVSVIWFPPDKRVRDAESLVAFQKAAIDSLVDVGLWPDDHSGWVIETRQRIAPVDRANPRIEIVISEIDEVSASG